MNNKAIPILTGLAGFMLGMMLMRGRAQKQQPHSLETAMDEVEDHLDDAHDLRNTIEVMRFLMTNGQVPEHKKLKADQILLEAEELLAELQEPIRPRHRRLLNELTELLLLAPGNYDNPSPGYG